MKLGFIHLNNLFIAALDNGRTLVYDNFEPKRKAGGPSCLGASRFSVQVGAFSRVIHLCQRPSVMPLASGDNAAVRPTTPVGFGPGCLAPGSLPGRAAGYFRFHSRLDASRSKRTPVQVQDSDGFQNAVQ
jgi:hypothetical protein